MKNQVILLVLILFFSAAYTQDFKVCQSSDILNGFIYRSPEPGSFNSGVNKQIMPCRNTQPQINVYSQYYLNVGYFDNGNMIGRTEKSISKIKNVYIMPLLVSEMQFLNDTLQQQVLKYKRAKNIFGISTIATTLTGGYFLYSSKRLADRYPTATRDATNTYDRMKQHKLISYISFGAAIPLGVLFFIKTGQQLNIQRNVNFTAMPTQNGALVGFSLAF